MRQGLSGGWGEQAGSQGRRPSPAIPTLHAHLARAALTPAGARPLLFVMVVQAADVVSPCADN